MHGDVGVVLLIGTSDAIGSVMLACRDLVVLVA